MSKLCQISQSYWKLSFDICFIFTSGIHSRKILPMSLNKINESRGPRWEPCGVLNPTLIISDMPSQSMINKCHSYVISNIFPYLDPSRPHRRGRKYCLLLRLRLPIAVIAEKAARPGRQLHYPSVRHPLTSLHCHHHFWTSWGPGCVRLENLQQRKGMSDILQNVSSK